MTKKTLTQELLKELLHYDPETGVFKWLQRSVEYFSDEPHCRSWNTKYAGKEAGTPALGYISIAIFGHPYRAHRLAWLYETGEFPEEDIDHRNHIRNDNRFINLRSVPHNVNTKNASFPKDNTSGIVGVGFHKKSQKWRATIFGDGENIHLGVFSSKEEAILVRASAEKEYGYHQNHGLKKGDISV